MTDSDHLSPQEEQQRKWEEYRMLRLKVRRQAMRKVRNTLLIIALLAAGWFIYLYYQESRDKRRAEENIPVPVPAVTVPDSSTPPAPAGPSSPQSESTAK